MRFYWSDYGEHVEYLKWNENGGEREAEGVCGSVTKQWRSGDILVLLSGSGSVSVGLSVK